MNLYSLIYLVILVLDIIAIIDIIKSRMESTMKLIWILLVLFLPLIGMVLYFAIGKKKI